MYNRLARNNFAEKTHTYIIFTSSKLFLFIYISLNLYGIAWMFNKKIPRDILLDIVDVITTSIKSIVL